MGEDVTVDEQDAGLDDLFGVESKALADGDYITDTKSALSFRRVDWSVLIQPGW